MPTRFNYFPHRCFFCRAPADAYLCHGCEADLPTLHACCQMCSLPMPVDEAARTLCGDCLRHSKPFALSVVPFLYGFPLDRMLQRFKARDPYTLSRYLAPQLVSALARRYDDDRLPEALVPVPLHWFRRLRRGHNQTEVLCDFLSGATHLPRLDALRKCRSSAAQKTLDRKARLANLGGTFSCSGGVEGKHLALIDDVITTCATATRAAECLLAAGARRVDVWALARTP